MAQRRLTPKGQEMVNAGRQLKEWTAPGQTSAYQFQGDFYHKGVDLGAGEVLSIMADQVFADAQEWAAKWNRENPDELFFFAGIDFQGPAAGWWEDKGKEKDPPFGSGKRYHKFGGLGTATILTKG